jgi:hypothetical protein
MRAFLSWGKFKDLVHLAWKRMIPGFFAVMQLFRLKARAYLQLQSEIQRMASNNAMRTI